MTAPVPPDAYLAGGEELRATLARYLGWPPDSVGHFIVVVHDARTAWDTEVVCCCDLATSNAPAVLASMARQLDDRARRHLS